MVIRIFKLIFFIKFYDKSEGNNTTKIAKLQNLIRKLVDFYDILHF